MTEIRETELPGVGVCHDFETATGRRIGVVCRASGRRELVTYDPADPDAVDHSVDLSATEAANLARLLGGDAVVERTAGIHGLVEGLALDWIPLPRDAGHRTIAELAIRERTGASIVAIVRPDGVDVSPGPDSPIGGGDTVVVVGSPEAVAAAARLLGG